MQASRETLSGVHSVNIISADASPGVTLPTQQRLDVAVRAEQLQQQREEHLVPVDLLMTPAPSPVLVSFLGGIGEAFEASSAASDTNNSTPIVGDVPSHPFQLGS